MTPEEYTSRTLEERMVLRRSVDVAKVVGMSIDDEQFLNSEYFTQINLSLPNIPGTLKLIETLKWEFVPLDKAGHLPEKIALSMEEQGIIGYARNGDVGDIVAAVGYFPLYYDKHDRCAQVLRQQLAKIIDQASNLSGVSPQCCPNLVALTKDPVVVTQYSENMTEVVAEYSVIGEAYVLTDKEQQRTWRPLVLWPKCETFKQMLDLARSSFNFDDQQYSDPEQSTFDLVASCMSFGPEGLHSMRHDLLPPEGRPAFMAGTVIILDAINRMFDGMKKKHCRTRPMDGEQFMKLLSDSTSEMYRKEPRLSDPEFMANSYAEIVILRTKGKGPKEERRSRASKAFAVMLQEAKKLHFEPLMVFTIAEEIMRAALENEHDLEGDEADMLIWFERSSRERDPLLLFKARMSLLLPPSHTVN
jgi:hypothetical protein